MWPFSERLHSKARELHSLFSNQIQTFKYRNKYSRTSKVCKAAIWLLPQRGT